jgi:hypothetical protein
MGTVTATTDIGNMLGNVLLQPGIGILPDRTGRAPWLRERIYTVQSYETGFIPIVAWPVLSCVSITLTRKTRCRQRA